MSSLFFFVLFSLVTHSFQLDCVNARFTNYEDFKKIEKTDEGKSCTWTIIWKQQENSTTTHTFDLKGAKENVNGCGKIMKSDDGLRNLTCGCNDKDECNGEFDRLDRLLSNLPDSVEVENIRDSLQRLIIGQEDNRIFWRNLWISLGVCGALLLLLLIAAAGFTWWCCICCKREEERMEEEKKRMQEEGIVATPIIAYDPYYGSYASTVYMCTPGKTVVPKGGKKEQSKTSKVSKKDISKKDSKKESKISQKSKKSEKSKKSQISESVKSQTKSVKTQKSSKVISGSTEVTATTNPTASAEPQTTQGNNSSVLSAPLNL